MRGRKIFLVLAGLVMLIGGGVSWAADTGTLTLNSDERIKPPGAERAVRVIEWDWLSDGSGDCNASTSLTAVVYGVTGTVVGVHAIPEGDTSDNYDVTVIDDDGVDVLNGAGTDFPQSATSVENYRFPVDFLSEGPIVLVDRRLTLVVAAGGAAKGGVIRVYILLP